MFWGNLLYDIENIVDSHGKEGNSLSRNRTMMNNRGNNKIVSQSYNTWKIISTEINDFIAKMKLLGKKSLWKDHNFSEQ